MQNRRILACMLWATALLVATAIWMSAVQPRVEVDLPKRWDSPLIALELSTSVGEARLAMGDSDQQRRLYSILNRDYFFAVFYGALFALQGWLLTRRGCRACRIAGWIAMIGAAFTVYFDVRENLATQAVLKGGSGFAAMNFHSLAKWGMAGVTALSLSMLFPRRLPIDTRVKVYSWAICALYVLASSYMLRGVLFEQEHYSLQQAMPPVTLAIAMQTLMWLRAANRAEFLDSL